MRSIASLKDCEIALRQMEDRLNLLFISDVINLNKRRIVNAHPSKDAYDYVVRKELFDLQDKTAIKQIGSSDSGPLVTVDYDVAVFGIGIETNIETGVDVCPHHIAVFNGRFIKCYAKIKTPPLGGGVSVNIRLNGQDSVFTGGSFLIPEGSEIVETTDQFVVTNISEEDFLTIDVISIGSVVPGSTLVVKLKYKKL